MDKVIVPNKLDTNTFNNIYKVNSSNFTEWTFSVPNETVMGLLCGFSEVWAFQANYSQKSVQAQRIIKVTDDSDRGFTFTYNNDSTVTVRTTSTVWGGAFVIMRQ